MAIQTEVEKYGNVCCEKNMQKYAIIRPKRYICSLMLAKKFN